MKNFLDIDTQIEENEKFLAFYYENYKKTLDKFNLLIVIYSVVFVFFIQVMKFPFDMGTYTKAAFYSYLTLASIAIFFLLKSLYNSFLLLKPVDVAYISKPKSFYKDTMEKYSKLLETDDESELNEYVKLSYLEELEEAVSLNLNLFVDKGKFYYKAFINLLRCLIPFTICIGIVSFFPKEIKPVKTEIINVREFMDRYDSIIIKQTHHGNSSNK